LKTGKIIVITAPSGSGKTTMVRRLLEDCKALEFSISACTRNPRDGEVHSKDYHFISVDEFRKLIEEDAFVEWEMVYEGKYYGTPKSELERIWAVGKTPMVDIDVQGALAISKKYPENCTTIFIEAPSLDVLRERLIFRGTETPSSLEERINKAALELKFAPQFDHIIVNDDLDKACAELQQVVSDFAGC
jgi:guanylate kinase